MNIKYRDVVIAYSEERNQWTADDYKPKESLALMKAAIDRKLDVPEKGDKFQRFDALYLRDGIFKRVTVTSICEDGGIRISQDGVREKVRDYYARQYLRKLNSESEPLAIKYSEITAQMRKLQNDQSEIMRQLKTII